MAKIHVLKTKIFLIIGLFSNLAYAGSFTDKLIYGFYQGCLESEEEAFIMMTNLLGVF